MELGKGCQRWQNPIQYITEVVLFLQHGSRESEGTSFSFTHYHLIKQTAERRVCKEWEIQCLNQLLPLSHRWQSTWGQGALRDQVCHTVDRPCFEIRADLVGYFAKKGENSRVQTENSPAVYLKECLRCIKAVKIQHAGSNVVHTLFEFFLHFLFTPCLS